MTQADRNFNIELSGEIDLTKAEASTNGFFSGEGLGKMTLVLKDGDNTINVNVHKLSFEGVSSQEEPKR